MMTEKDRPATPRPSPRPLSFVFATWYAYIFAAMFLLYGGINVVLALLERNYDNVGQSVIFVLVGLVLIMPAYALKEQKTWGWYGVIGINGLVILLALFSLGNVYNLIALVLSGIALIALLMPQTKQFVFKGR